MTGQLKAYVVQDDYEGQACIRFAHYNVVARREGANELDSDFSEVTCERAPQFDQYVSDGDVPPMVLLEAGWHFGCSGCGQERVELDGEDEVGPFEPVVIGRDVFCRQACKEANDARIAHREAERQRGIDETLREFPGVTICHVMPECFMRDGKPSDQSVPGVTFTFPGGQHPVHWYVGDATVSAAKVDEDAWRAWRACMTEVA